MKRMISLILAVLMFSLLPVTAMASGDEYYETGTVVSTPEELREALANPGGENVLISSEFTWGDGDKILIIDFYGNEETDSDREDPEIKLMGSLTVPEDWTVICYEHLYFVEMMLGCDITIDGSFSLMDSAIFQTSYSPVRLTVNGYFATSPTEQTNLSGLSDVTVNGHFENLNSCNLPDVTVGSGGQWSLTGRSVWMDGGLTLADGVTLTGNEIALSGDLTANGSAVLDCTVLARQNISLIGDLSIANFGLRAVAVVTIPAGSKVYMEDLQNWDGMIVNIAGDLTIGTGYHTVENSTLHLEGGTLSLVPWIQLGSKDGNSVIDGTGTLKLYAEPHPVYDTFNGYPRIFGLDSDEGISECVASTVTVWRNWADCVHTWVETGVVVAPTCGTEGYTEQACSGCGTTGRINIVEPSGEHNLTYTPSEWSESEVIVSCDGCERANEVRIYVEADEAEFEGVPVEIAHVYCSGDLIADEDLPEIMYINNDMAGATATAFAEIGGYTISVTFEIVGCVHEAGTPATCQQPAVCGKCGESFGGTEDHTWGSTMSYNETNHFFTCTVEGCGAVTSSEEELFGILEPMLIEQWAILMEMGMATGGAYIPLTDHIYESGSEICAICGCGGTAAVPGDMDGDGKVSDADVARLLWHTLFEDAYEINGDADFNKDGTVDDQDVAYLLWHTLFPEQYPIN